MKKKQKNIDEEYTKLSRSLKSTSFNVMCDLRALNNAVRSTAATTKKNAQTIDFMTAF